MIEKNKPIVSLTKKDFVVQTFRAGGKGGQKQNKTSSGVRIIHPASGARGESREERSQHQNKKIAFERLCNSHVFKCWLHQKHIELLEGMTLEEKIKQSMSKENLLIEIKNEDGEWIELIDDSDDY